MTEFLNWLFSKGGALKLILGVWFAAIENWGHWYPLRGFKLIHSWWGKLYDVFNDWYERLHGVIYEFWGATYSVLVTYIDPLLSLIFVWYDRILYVVNTVWWGFNRVFQEWWSKIYTLFHLWWVKAEDVIYNWYSIIAYYVENLPSLNHLISDWFPWLAWLLETDNRELLFFFIQNPGQMIWLYIVDILEDKLEELLNNYW